MSSKLIMANTVTGQVKFTQAKVDGSVFRKYVKDGFTPVGFVTGWAMSCHQLDIKKPEHWVIVDTYQNILDSDDESTEFTQDEIKQFKEDWGQSQQNHGV